MTVKELFGGLYSQYALKNSFTKRFCILAVRVQPVQPPIPKLRIRIFDQVEQDLEVI